MATRLFPDTVRVSTERMESSDGDGSPALFGPSVLGRIGAIAAAIVLFLFSIQLLSAATGTFAPVLGPVLDAVVDGGFPAIGTSWLAAYVALNGSVVAAVALSLYAAELVSAGQLFLMVVGSRLGAAGVVVLIGAIDFLSKRQYSLRESTSLGLLTFLVTHTIYVPAAVLGVVLISVSGVDLVSLGGSVAIRLRWFELFAPAAETVVGRVGGPAALLFAFLLVVSSLRLFDWMVSTVDTSGFHSSFFAWLRRPAVSFALGLVLTGVSTSVAFSLGVVVPLYNRGYVARREVVPYIMGASLGTLTDTLFVALALGSNAGLVTVLLVFGTAGVTTVGALLVYDWYLGFVGAVHDCLLADIRSFLLGVGVLLLVPVLLVFLPW
jgi:sodium-dependent phosphate cotransporter